MKSNNKKTAKSDIENANAFKGVSIIVTSDPEFVEAKAAPNATAIDVLNAYGTVTETVKNLLLAVGMDERVTHSAMDYAHNQAMSGVKKVSSEMVEKLIQ